jgi:hypothetical protein
MGNCKQLRIGLRLSGSGVAFAGALLLAGCVTSTTAVVAPESLPALELVATGPLQIPANCEPTGGAVYRTSYVVRTDGRVTDAAPESGGGCVQEALRQWVSSFEYRPPDEPTTAVIDWMAVQASNRAPR